MYKAGYARNPPYGELSMCAAQAPTPPRRRSFERVAAARRRWAFPPDGGMPAPRCIVRRSNMRGAGSPRSGGAASVPQHRELFRDVCAVSANANVSTITQAADRCQGRWLAMGVRPCGAPTCTRLAPIVAEFARIRAIRCRRDVRCPNSCEFGYIRYVPFLA